MLFGLENSYGEDRRTLLARQKKISGGSYPELLVCFVFMECVNFRLTKVKIPFRHGSLSLSLSLPIFFQYLCS